MRSFPRAASWTGPIIAWASLAYADGDFQAAAAEYQQVVDRWPQSPLAPRALYGLGWAKLSQNDYAGAERLFDAMVAKYPATSWRRAPATPAASLGTSGKNFGPAIEDVQALLAADPTPAEKSDARYLLGLCQAGLKQDAEAAATFQAILSDDPKYAGADKVLYELAWALKQQNKEQEAAEALRPIGGGTCRQSAGGRGPISVGRSRPTSQGDFQDAVAVYRTALVKAGRGAWGEKAAHNWAGRISGSTTSPTPNRRSTASERPGPKDRSPATPLSWRPSRC